MSMANTVKLKQSAVAGKVPATTDLALGELAVNTYDGKLFLKKKVGTTETVVDLTAAAAVVSSFNTRTGAVSLTAADVNSAMGAVTNAAKMPVGTTAQRPTGEVGMYRMNSTTGEPEWWDSNHNLWRPFMDYNYTVEYIIVAGGGGGGYNVAAGGGAGGAIAGSFVARSNIDAYPIVIGSGGAGSAATSTNGSNGGNTTAFGLTAIGGGGGGANSQNGSSGGSGGGAGSGGASAGSGTGGQGNSGGLGYRVNPYYNGGGGGGKNAAGGNASSTKGGDGGAGIQWSDGNYYGGGGGGGWLDNAGALGSAANRGNGGLGGGGSGGVSKGSCAVEASAVLPATSGSANTGGGGGGGGLEYGSNAVGGNGGSGIVIMRYLGVPRGSGGTVTSAGGYTYHTFSSSGTFTA